MDHICDHKLQLHCVAAKTNNTLAIAAIYSSALGIIDRDPAKERHGNALTLLLAHQWLANNDYELQPMTLEEANAAVDSYHGLSYIFPQLQSMCLEYGSYSDLMPGETLVQGVARRFHKITSRDCQLKPLPQAEALAGARGYAGEATPQRSWDSIRSAESKVRTAPQPASDIIPGQWVRINNPILSWYGSGRRVATDAGIHVLHCRPLERSKEEVDFCCH